MKITAKHQPSTIETSAIAEVSFVSERNYMKRNQTSPKVPVNRPRPMTAQPGLYPSPDSAGPGRSQSGYCAPRCRR